MITTEYKNYLIIVDEYSSPKDCYYEIHKNGVQLTSTLHNDDKMWDKDSAIISAKKDIDNYLKIGEPYFKPQLAYLPH